MINAWSHLQRSVRFQPLVQLTTFTVLVASFLVLIVAVTFQQNFSSVLTHWGRQVKVDVYMQDNATDVQTAAVKSIIESSRLFANTQYFTKDQAAARFKNRMGKYLPGLLDDLGADNPLPASFELEATKGIVSQRAYEHLLAFARGLKKQAGVDDVSYGQGWVENYASALHAFSVSVAVLMFVLLAGAVFVVGNAVGNSITQRRDEIEIMELFGATRSMIIRPYIFEGFAMGLAATVTALILAHILYSYEYKIMSQSLSFWNFQAAMRFLSTTRIFLALLSGTFLGGLSAYLWARKVATGWAAAEAK